MPREYLQNHLQSSKTENREFAERNGTQTSQPYNTPESDSPGSPSRDTNLRSRAQEQPPNFNVTLKHISELVDLMKTHAQSDVGDPNTPEPWKRIGPLPDSIPLEYIRAKAIPNIYKDKQGDWKSATHILTICAKDSVTTTFVHEPVPRVYWLMWDRVVCTLEDAFGLGCLRVDNFPDPISFFFLLRWMYSYDRKELDTNLPFSLLLGFLQNCLFLGIYDWEIIRIVEAKLEGPYTQ
jgi:hypothetical protein